MVQGQAEATLMDSGGPYHAYINMSVIHPYSIDCSGHYGSKISFAVNFRIEQDLRHPISITPLFVVILQDSY